MDLAFKAAICLMALGTIAFAAYIFLTRGILWGRKKR